MRSGWRLRASGLIIGSAVAFVLLTFLLSSTLLNHFIPYSRSGGGLLVKIHPATWLIAPVVVAAQRLWRISWRLPEKSICIAILLFSVTVVLLLGSGNSSLAATLLDVFVAPFVVVAALSMVAAERVRVVFRCFVWLAVINATLLFFEFATHTNVIAGEASGWFFRPSGLSGHPINSATVLYCAMYLVASGATGPRISRPLLLVLLLGVAVCGVRGPLAMAIIIIGWHLLKPYYPRGRAIDYVLDFGLVAMLPIAAIFAYSLGAFDRILSLGLWEDSAQSRFTIFNVFDLLTPSEFWWGTDSYASGEFLATQATGSNLIENAFVAIVLQAGFWAMTLTCVAILVAFFPAMRRNFIFLLMVIVVGFTTIGFATKSPIAPAVILCAFWTIKFHSKTVPSRNLAPGLKNYV